MRGEAADISGDEEEHKEQHVGSARQVRFASEPVTEVRTRPRTAEHEKPPLFYGEDSFNAMHEDAEREEQQKRATMWD